MGYLAKKATEKKVAVATGPVGFPTQDDASWSVRGRVRAAAIIRGAALDLKLKHAYSNVNKTGRNPLLAGAIVGAATSVDTILWMRETGRRSWEVWLGAVSVNGDMSVDWQCEVIVNPGQVSISTPKYFTRDGTMLKEKQHDQFRQMVFERMAAGAPREPGDSIELSKYSMATSGVSDLVEPLGALVDEFCIESAKPLEQVGMDLFSGGFGSPQLECTDGRFRWGLGLPTGWAGNWVELVAKPKAGEGVRMDGRFTLSGEGSQVSQIVATEAARWTWGRLVAVTKFRDPDVVVVAPPSRLAVPA
jgi:hypothetical protein